MLYIIYWLLKCAFSRMHPKLFFCLLFFEKHKVHLHVNAHWKGICKKHGTHWSFQRRWGEKNVLLYKKKKNSETPNIRPSSLGDVNHSIRQEAFLCNDKALTVQAGWVGCQALQFSSVPHRNCHFHEGCQISCRWIKVSRRAVPGMLH